MIDKIEVISALEESEAIANGWLLNIWKGRKPSEAYLMLLGFYLLNPSPRFAIQYAAMQEIDFLIEILNIKSGLETK